MSHFTPTITLVAIELVRRSRCSVSLKSCFRLVSQSLIKYFCKTFNLKFYLVFSLWNKFKNILNCNVNNQGLFIFYSFFLLWFFKIIFYILYLINIKKLLNKIYRWIYIRLSISTIFRYQWIRHELEG